jgi:hypothetical protein
MTTPLTNWPTFADTKNSELLAALKKWGENRNGHGIITRTDLAADLNMWLDQQRLLSRPSLSAIDSYLYKYLKNQTTTKWLEKYLAQVISFSVPIEQLDKAHR